MSKTVKLELQDGVTPEELAHDCNDYDGEYCIWDITMLKCPFKMPCHAIRPEHWEKLIEDDVNGRQRED